MKILFRDSNGGSVGSIEIDAESETVLENRCDGVYVTDIDSMEDGHPLYRMDFSENDLLRRISTAELLSEIERRIEGC